MPRGGGGGGQPVPRHPGAGHLHRHRPHTQPSGHHILAGKKYLLRPVKIFYLYLNCCYLLQAILVVQFMYKGVLERLSEQEISQLLDSVRHLEIVGMRGGSQEAAGIKMEAMDIEEDDVFTDQVNTDTSLAHNRILTSDWSTQAVDLSPVNRHPPTPLLSGNLDLASRRMASLSKISQALLRNSGKDGQHYCQ